DLQLVAFVELRGLDALAVDEGAVEAPLVLDVPAAALLDEHGVLAGDRDVVEEDPAVGRTADRRALALRRERLAGPSAPRANDERRPVDTDVPERLEQLVAILGRERLRLLDALRLALVQECAALGAVVRGLRVLEAAFGAVDVAHSLGGAAFPARISVSEA